MLRKLCPLRIALLLVLIAPLGCGAAEQQVNAEKRFPLDDQRLESSEGHVVSYADVLEKARPAVVSVTTSRIVHSMRGGANGSPLEEFLRRFYGIPGPDGSPSPSDPRERGTPGQQQGEERLIPNGLGSGVIISSDGYILTNNHVVTDPNGEQADEIMVQLNNREEVEAELVGRDERTDIALLKIDREDLPFMPMADSENLRVGDIVFAIGNPLGVGQTTTMGIVSATRRTIGILGQGGYEDFIQTDAAINQGNSGGALIDADGRLVGINSAIISRSGGSIGIGFAIPTRLARSIVVDLIETGEVRRGFLGVSISDLDRDMAEAFNLDHARGALVESVQPDSPAAEAGMERGDVILSINGREVENSSDLRLRVAGMSPKEEVDLGIVRDGDPQTVKVTLGNLDEQSADGIGMGGGSSVLEGVRLQVLNAERSDSWNVEAEEGVLVTDVEARSPYASELRPGMVILEANDQEVKNIDDLRKSLRSGAVNKLWVEFQGRRGFLALRMP
ncbi:MAG: peptidase S1 and S6 chymotrypsin/Hap [Puniceicoccaceae bacterium 5H]|nr:MAG: peptidase S1 and S6 chymotrypsin/Hap [Puniceicoccaceae bacterium 5H]